MREIYYAGGKFMISLIRYNQGLKVNAIRLAVIYF
jgi:hypothetical protein